MTEKEIICKRCGLCCYMHDEETETFIKCKYLIKIGQLTSCRTYSNRLGKMISNNHVCTHRQNSNFDYVGCPYNINDGRPIVKRKENGELYVQRN